MADIATIGVRLDGGQYLKESAKIQSTNKKTADSTDKMSGRMKKSFSGLLSSINPLRSGLSALVSGISFGAVIKNASDFETKMAEVSTLLDDTSGVDSLADSLNELSVQFGTAPTEQAGAVYDVISAGAGSASEAIETLTAANKLAIGGVTDIGTATDGLTSVLNAYAEDGLSATEISDSLFTAMKAGKTTIGELASSLGVVAPLAVGAGVSFDELNASIAALTKGGIRTREAVTGVRAILAAVAKPTAEATEMAEQLGIEFNAAALEGMGFQKFLEMLKEATKGNTDTLAQLFGGVEALVPIMNLTGAGASDFVEILGAMQTKAGATEIAFAKMQETFKQDALRPFLSTVSVLAQEIGTVLLPAVGSFLKALTSGINAIREFADEIVLLIKLIGIGGGLYLGLNALPMLLTTAQGAMLLLTGQVTALTGALGRLITVMATTVTSFGLMRSALVGLATFAAAWEFGKYLSDNFVEARIAGLAMTEALLVSWERLQGGWRIVQAIYKGQFNEIKRIRLETTLAVAQIKSEMADLRLVEMEAEERSKKTGGKSSVDEVKQTKIDIPEIPKPPADTTIGNEVSDSQKKINDLLKEYAKNAALASDATELERIQYELLNGELAKAGGYRQQELLAAAAKSDEIKLNREAQTILDGYAHSLAVTSNATEQQRIEYELTKGALEELNDERKEEIRLAAQLQDQSRLVTDASAAIRSMNEEMARMNMTTQEQATIFELTNGRLQGLGDSYAGLEEQLIMTARALDDARFAKEAEQIEQAIDPAARYAVALERLNMLRDRGVLSAETYSEAVYRETLRANRSVGVMREGFKGFFSDLLDGTMTIQDAFTRMTDTILARLNDIAAESVADQLTKGLFSGVVPTKGDNTGIGGLVGGTVKKFTPTEATDTPANKVIAQISPAAALGGGMGMVSGTPIPVIIVEDQTATGGLRAVAGGGEPTPVEVVASQTGTATEAATNTAEGSQGMLDAIAEKFTTVRDSITGGFSKIFGFLKTGFSGVVDIGTGLFSSIGSGISQIFQLITQAITTMTASSAASGGGGFFSAIAGMFTGGGGAAAATGGTFVIPEDRTAHIKKFSQGGSAIAGALMSSMIAMPVAANQIQSFANGASFRVNGSGGLDSQIVMFKASPNERVTITKPDQVTGFADGGGINFSKSTNEKIAKFASGGVAQSEMLTVLNKHNDFDIPKFATGGMIDFNKAGGISSQLDKFKIVPSNVVNVSKEDAVKESMTINNTFNVSAPEGRIDRRSQQQIQARVGQSVDNAKRRNT